MTAPNLTPAEALECLRDYQDMTVSAERWSSKWGVGDPVDAGIAALETLLSEHEATKAKLAAYEAKLEPSDAHLGWKAKEPAAAVPSDEEIVQAIRKADSTRTPYAVGHLTEAVEMLAKRIGVKL